MVNRRLATLLACALLLIAFIGLIKTFEATPDSGSTEDEGTSVDTGDTVAPTSVVNIVLNGDTITSNSTSVKISGSTVLMSHVGSYRITGTLSDGQIVVDTEEDGEVELILSGVDITCTTSAPINVVNADETVIVLEEGTENSVTDGSSYILEAGEDEPNAAIFSKDDLTIEGSGSLTVDANYNDGIASKDGLTIESGIITVDSVDDGIRGKDYIVVNGGTITLSAGGDGLKSDNEEDAGMGTITINGGTIDITSGEDAIQAISEVHIIDGVFTIKSGGGSGAKLGEDDSAKGIKATTSVVIDGGEFVIDSADDALHSNGAITINGGEFIITTGDDGAHADTSLTVNGGEIKVTKSYEGLESAALTINDGVIYVTSSDDGLNAAGGNDGSGVVTGRPGDTFTSTGSYTLKITGGYIVVDALGDGVDINGSIEMSGGTLIVNGPTSNGNGAIDYDGTFNMTGGLLVAVGSSGMAMAPSTTSTQCSLLVNFNTAVKAGTLIHIQTSGGEEILTFEATRSIQSIAFSSPAITKGTTYEIYYGGTTTGVETDGVYTGGTYTGGTKYTSLTVTSVVTRTTR